jgi:hypothetical protein
MDVLQNTIQQVGKNIVLHIYHEFFPSLAKF